MGALSGEVKLPAVGQVKKAYVVVGGVVILGLGVMYARNRKAAASSTSSSAIDPATGYPTGSPEDLAALQQQQTYAPFPGGDGGSGGSVGNVGTQVTNGPPFASNAAWAQYAEAQLSGIQNGPAPADVAAALGSYLAGQPVTADQRHLIDQAIAFAGAVPVTGPNGFPPSINLAAPSTGPTPPRPIQNQPPPPDTSSPAGPGPGPGPVTSHTTITAGESVNPMLTFFGMSKQQLDDLNPGITYYTKPGGVLAFGVTRTVTVLGGKGW